MIPSYLVTGGAGFVGSRLVGALLARGDRVLVVDDASGPTARTETPGPAHPRLTWFRRQVEEAPLTSLMEECQAVVHLAAVVGMRRTMEQPRRTYARNVRASWAVLAAAERCRTPLLLVSSSEVYGRRPPVPVPESAPLVSSTWSEARWAYAASKVRMEEAGERLQRRRGVPVWRTRLFNTVGPGQSGRHGMVLPRMVEQALTNQPITIFGDGDQTRCLVHVDDVVDGLLRILDCVEEPGEVLNLGSSEETTVAALARLVQRCASSSSPLLHLNSERVYGADYQEVRRRVPELDRAQRRLGWTARRSLREVVEDTVTTCREQLPRLRTAAL